MLAASGRLGARVAAGGMAGKIARALLAVALAAGVCFPAPSVAFAGDPVEVDYEVLSTSDLVDELTVDPAIPVYSSAERDDAIVPFALSTLAQVMSQAKVMAASGEVDLAASWKAQSSGLDSLYTIAVGGTYRLGEDVSSSNALVVNAPGQDIVVRFDGHTLEATGVGEDASKTVVRIAAAKSVSFEGDAAGASKLVGAGSADVWLVSSEAADCAVSMSDLALELAPSSKEQVNLGAHCVRAGEGSLSLDSCVLNMDFGLQRLTSASQVKAAEPASAVYASPFARSLSVVDCDVTAVGTPCISLDDVSETTSLGNVYDVYSDAESTSVSGGSFEAVSTRGCAACLCGSSMTVEGPEIELKASAGQIAAGVLSDTVGGVLIDAPISFSTDASYQSRESRSAALRATVSIGYLLGSSGPADGAEYSVFVKPADAADANVDGVVVGSFEQGTSPSAKRAWLSAMKNALGADAVCELNRSTSYVYFKLIEDDDHAAARIGTTYYSTVAEGIAKLTDGATLTLLRDAGDLAVSTTFNATIDLNGNAINSLSYTASARESGTGLVVKNGTVSGTTLLSAGRVGVYHDAALPLELDSVSIEAAVTDNNVMGVYASATAAGALALKGCDVDVTGTRSGVSFTAYGVRVDSSGAAPLALTNTAVAARTSSAGVSVVGVAGVDVAIADGSVSAVGTTSTTVGVQASGTASVKGAGVSVRLKNAASAAYGIQATSASSTCVVDSSAVSVESDVDASDADYWCVYGAGASGSASGASLTLKGSCSFSSASGKHVGDGLPQVALNGFSLTGSGALRISQAVVGGNVGFAGSAGADLSTLASRIEPVAGSAYDGWKLVAVPGDSSQLKWVPSAASSDAPVQLVHDGAMAGTYGSVAEAVGAAQAGDIVRLTCNMAEAAALSVSKGITIDLAGHELTLRAGKAAVSGGDPGAAVAFTGSGKLAIVSQGGAGRLALEAGAPSEGSATAVYQGIAVSGGGSLRVDESVAVSVTYTGSSALATQRQITLRGIAVTDGSLDLQGSLDVVSTTRADRVGALYACGVFADAAEGATVNVAKGAASAVTVSNGTASIVTDANNYGSSNSDDGSPAFLPWYLDKEADPALYKLVQAQFKVKASYDNPDDFEARSEYGAGIYYTSSALVLEADGKWYDGMKVWAFTDVIAPKNVGKLDAIEATHFFLQVPVETPARASGIATGTGAGTVNVSVAGSVAASCPAGDAVALDAAGTDKTTWSCADGATLDATGSTRVRSVLNGDYDLRGVIDFGKDFDDKVTYRGRSRTVGYFAKFESPSARAASVGEAVHFAKGDGLNVSTSALDSTAFSGLDDTAGSDDDVVFMVGDAEVARFASPASVDLATLSGLANRPQDAARVFAHSGWTTSRDEFADPELGTTGNATPKAGTVYHATFNGSASPDCSITFKNMFDSSGAALPDVTIGATYGQTVGEALAAASPGGLAMPAPSSYVDDGVSYRFVGWHDYGTQSTASTQIWDPDDLADGFTVDASSNAGNSCDVVFWATYVPVASDECLITFEVDGMQSMCSVKLGERPYYRLANTSGATSEAPSKVDTVTGEQYEFTGWADVTGGGEGQVYPLVLPMASGDATYRAKFKVTPSNVKLTFYTMKSNGAGGYVISPTVVNTTYDKSMQEAADSVIAVGDKVSFGGLVYTLLGWSLRQNDVEPVYYTPGNPITTGNWTTGVMSSQSYSGTYYGVYQSNAHMVDVSFVDGGTVIGDAEIDASSTIDEAFAFTGAKAPADKSSTELFLGWNTSASAKSNLNGSLITIEGLAGATAEKLTLYSVYGAPPNYSVNFHDEQNTKLLYSVYVARNRTVEAVAKEKGVTISAPSKAGSFFNGWRSAEGKLFPLNTQVTGPAELFASYGVVSVKTDDATDANATVTCTVAGLEDSREVTFTLHQRKGVDSIVARAAARAGYSILKSYDMSLSATSAAGNKSTLKGTIGLADIQIYVGKKYADSKIRVFWIGGDGTVSHSAEKEVDSKGYITVSVGDYNLGDKDEGGNLAVAYQSGSGNTGSLSNSSSLSLGSDSLNLGSGLGAGMSLNSRGLSSGLGSASSNLSVSATTQAALNNNSNTLGTDGSIFDTTDEATGDALDSEGSSDGAALDGDTVAFMMACLVFVALIGLAVWKLFLAAARRRSSDDDDIPVALTTLARGIRF